MLGSQMTGPGPSETAPQDGALTGTREPLSPK